MVKVSVHDFLDIKIAYMFKYQLTSIIFGKFIGVRVHFLLFTNKDIVI